MDKNTYEQKAQAKLDEIDGRIQVLKAKKDGLEADAKIEYDKKIEELNSLKDETLDKFNKLKSSSSDAWDEFKAGFEKSTEIMESSLKAALSKFDK
ncbi:coiled coil domain-containing protein [Campylobacterota bacterium DY0563]|uniref:hypothetical protein n=1 Tax=Halarcobacter sp. TaxID=2321133 RepID=UPI0029F5BAC3|nr:hypothetical protein [Halarcobacter sp.]